MTRAALWSWALTTAAGFLLLLIWLASGGAGRAPDDFAVGGQDARWRRRGYTRFAHSNVIMHGALALTGLLLWVVYSNNRRDPDYSPAPWFLFAVLCLVAILGLSMFRRWVLDRRSRPGEGEQLPAEQRLPAILVLLHGVSALVTLGLVLAVALDS